MRSSSSRFGVAALVGACLAAGATPAAPVVPAAAADSSPADRLRRDAERLEALGQWAGALELYLRLPAATRQQPEVRRRVQTCLRRLLQAARQRDPAYRSQVLGLSLYQAARECATVLGKLQANYVDRDRVTPALLVQTGAEELDAALADPWFRQEFLPGADPQAVATFRQHLRAACAGRDDLSDTRAAAKLVERLALDAQRELGLNPTVAVLEFACGACNALDEYSAYLPPGHGDELATPGGELAALGVRFGFAGGLFVEKVTPAGPAYAAGLRDGDRVLRLNAKAVDGLSRGAVVELFRNESGPVLEMDVAGADGGTVRPVRLPLDLPAVIGVRILEAGVGYVRLTGFTRLASQELEEAVLTLRMRGMRALVLDLRGNPGGLFTVAVQVAERFLADGLIVETRGRVPGATLPYHSGGGMTAWDFPVVVLIDHETASAAEVLAGALKDRGRAELFGQTTYGKGSIQGVLPLKSLGALRLTLARFFPPSGQAFERVGIAPHVAEADPDRQLELATARARALAAMRP